MNTVTHTELAQWAAQQTWSKFAVSVAEAFNKYGRLTEKQASALESMYAKAQAKAEAKPEAEAEAPANPVTEAGMYRSREDGELYRVKQSKMGRLYAVRFYVHGATKAERWVYAPGAIYRLSATDRMSVEEVASLGLQHGICIVCGAELSDPESVARGIGPVCAKKV